MQAVKVFSAQVVPWSEVKTIPKPWNLCPPSTPARTPHRPGGNSIPRSINAQLSILLTWIAMKYLFVCEPIKYLQMNEWINEVPSDLALEIRIHSFTTHSLIHSSFIH